MSDHYDRYNGMEEVHGTNLAEVGTDCISRQAVLNEFCHSCDGWNCNPNTCCKTEWIRKLPPIQPEPHEIGYDDCSNALLKMWMDNVLTDGEYYRIADKLNEKWGKREVTT